MYKVVKNDVVKMTREAVYQINRGRNIDKVYACLNESNGRVTYVIVMEHENDTVKNVLCDVTEEVVNYQAGNRKTGSSFNEVVDNVLKTVNKNLEGGKFVC